MKINFNKTTDNQNLNPMFGVHYTPKTLRRLKELTPEIIRTTKNEQEYELAKSAFENLVQAGKSVDGFLVELNDDYIKGFQNLSIRVKKRKGKVKDFLYPDYQDGRNLFKDNAITEFYKKCKFINSPEFIPQSEEWIENWAKHRKSQSRWKNFKDDMFWVWNDVTEKFEDCFDALGEIFSATYDFESGKTLWYPVSCIKNRLNNKIFHTESNRANSRKINEIRALIDKMRTKPIDIEVNQVKK